MSITRRSFVVGLTASIISPFTALKSSAQPWSAYPQPNHALLDINEAHFVFSAQEMSQWCWAACISSVFNYYGHPVSQSRIVSEAYGAIVDMPAVSGFVIAQAINRHWTDDRGRTFEARLDRVFDFDFGQMHLSNVDIVSALENEHPLIVGTVGHAVILIGFSYLYNPYGAIVPVAASVFDPWPGRGFRYLNLTEMTPPPLGGLRFLAYPKIH